MARLVPPNNLYKGKPRALPRISQSAMSMPLMARQAPAPMPWLASWKRYILSHTPVVSLASIPVISFFKVVSISFATAVCARPWCASPQPTRPPEVVTLTTTASRFTAVPMPSATRFASGIGNEVGNAWTSVMRRSRIQHIRVDEVEWPLAGEHAQHLGRRRHARAPARRDRHAGEVRRQYNVVQLEELVLAGQPIGLVDIQHGALDLLVLQEMNQGLFVDHRAASDVDDPCSLLHVLQGLFIDQMARLRRERTRHDHDVAFSQQNLQRHAVSVWRQSIHPALRSEDLHSEAMPANLGDAPADLADADDADGAALELHRADSALARLVPRFAAHGGRDGDDVAGKHEHRHDAVLGDRLGVHAGEIRDHHSIFVCFFQRHQIGSGAMDGYGLDARCGLEDVVGQLGADDDAVSVFGEPADGLGGAVRRVNHVCLFTQKLFAFEGDGIHQQHLLHSGSQVNTSCVRSSGKKPARKAGMACEATVSGVQPSARCTERSGRLCPMRKISLARTEKIWPLTSFASSESRNTARGAIFAVSIVFIFSTRAFCSGVSVGMAPIMRLQAKGAMQLERTLYFAMSSAMDLESAARPSFAAE